MHTDLVVLDGVGVAGATANEAARIQDHAPPNSVVISDATKALVWPWFDLESIGDFELRGVSRPIEIFRVIRDRPRSDHAGGPVPARPFVGRERELDRLAALFGGLARIGPLSTGHPGVPEPSVLVITGPAGVGKTRLVTEAAGILEITCHECTCSRFHQSSSLHPFRAILEKALDIRDTDEPETRLGKLRAHVDALGDATGDLPFLAAALDIPLPLLSPPADVDPGSLRQRALEVTARMLESVAGHATSMLFVDDLHWADQSTIDLLTLIISSPDRSMHLVVTARDDFDPPWPVNRVPRLQLPPLDHEAMLEIAALLPEGARVSGEDREHLIARSDGIPLFLEELLRTADAVDRGRVMHRSIRFGDHQIPPALLDPLLARLASPQVDLELAQAAATIGREVDRNLLQNVVRADDDEFQSRLDTLVAAGLVEPAGDGVIRFRHEMIREVAYETQKRTALWGNHGTIADELLGGASAVSPRISGEAAHHLERAHRYEEAIEAHLQAAKANQEVGAHAEATQRLTHTLELLDHIPAGDRRLQTELTLREMRSFSAVMAGGYSAPEAAVDYPRCVELCEGLTTTPRIVPSLIRSWSYYAFRGDLVEADRVVDSLIRQSEESGLTFPARQIGEGISGFFRGDFGTARRQLASVADSSWGATSGRPPPEWPLPNDAVCAVSAHLIPVLWINDDRLGADSRAELAMQRAGELAFPFGPFSVCYVNSMVALTRNIQDDRAGAAAAALEQVQLGERHGFAMWSLTGGIQLAITAVHQGSHDQIDQLAGLVGAWRQLGADAWTPYWLTELAIAQSAAGRDQDALRSLDDALAVAAATGVHFYSAETLRTEGRLRLRAGDRSGGGYLHQAVDLAVRQGAAVFERRARAAVAEMTTA